MSGGRTEAAALPRRVVTGVDPASDWVRSTVQLMAEELMQGAPASRLIAERLCDVLVLRALRETTATSSGTDWIEAIRDHRLAPALAAFHAEPGTHWTVTDLAYLASMSRSAFYERFTRVVGIPPGDYITRWRIHTACIHLVETSAPISQIARRAGFATDAGFSTAFKRNVGTTPRDFRRAELSQRRSDS